MPHRLLAALAVAVLALCAATASPAPAAGIPSVIRGQALHIALGTRSKALCTPRVQYADGTTQTGSAKRARRGGVTWALLVARTAPLGAGSWNVRCGSARAGAGRFVVVAQQASGGSSEVPRVVVDKQGFSQRPDSWGSGSSLSFGLLLHNTSGTQDAGNIYVLVNMVAANGELLGTTTHTVGFIGAGQVYAYGDSAGLRTQATVAKLELTIRVGQHQPTQALTTPELANVRVLPNERDANWVGEVDGEVLNTAQRKTLKGTHLSIVLLDAAGNPIGGGTGDTYIALPSGSRMVFVANRGFDAVRFEGAITPVITVEASYDAGG